jgi:dihydroorotate dehydrogenase (NAD+) catalytic subunit
LADTRVLDAIRAVRQTRQMIRLATAVATFPLVNPIICGFGEPVMTEAGIRAAPRVGAAGVIVKSVNEHPAGGRQLGRTDYVRLDALGVPTTGQEVSLFNRSGLTQRDTADWFETLSETDSCP